MNQENIWFSNNVDLSVKELEDMVDFQFGVSWIEILNKISKKNMTYDHRVTLHDIDYLKEQFEKLKSFSSK